MTIISHGDPAAAHGCLLLLLLLLLYMVPSCGWEMFHFPQERHPTGYDCCPVNKSRLWTKEYHGLDETSSAALKSLLHYKFYLPRTQLKTGISYYGAAIKLRKFVLKLLEGQQPLKIGVLGGSISWGMGATRLANGWFHLFSDWLASVSKGGLSSRNGCIPATPSAYMLMCLEESVDRDVDLVFVEYSLNDGVENTLVGNRILRTMEQLLRRVLALPGRPAVVLVQVPHVWYAEYEPFYHTSEDIEGALSGYYDIPTISLRDALYPLAALYPTDGFLWNQTYGGNHPGNSGHKILADLAVHLIQETARDLQTDPPDPEEQRDADRGLPEPMYEGNLPPENLTCVVTQSFKELVKESDGWTWVDEAGGKDANARGKWGFSSASPGSRLVFEVNTKREAYKKKARLPLLIHYLKSDRGMGIARAECWSGCHCDPLDIDAGLKAYHSQLVMAALRVTHHTQCRVRLTLLNDTTSGGHKFMVTGVTVVGTPEYPADVYTVDFWRNPA